MYTVNLTYFKESGKYYSEGCYDSEKAHLFEITEEVKQKVRNRELPGLMEGHSPFHVLIDVPDHQNRHFHLIPIDPEPEDIGDKIEEFENIVKEELLDDILDYDG